MLVCTRPRTGTLRRMYVHARVRAAGAGLAELPGVPRARRAVGACVLLVFVRGEGKGDISRAQLN